MSCDGLREARGQLDGLVMGVCLPILRSGAGGKQAQAAAHKCGHAGVSLRGPPESRGGGRVGVGWGGPGNWVTLCGECFRVSRRVRV